MSPSELPEEFVEIDGRPVRVAFCAGVRPITLDEWNLANCTSGATLRAACKSEGLPASGTNAAMAKRLVAAGLTRDQVEDRYGWRARQRQRPSGQ